MVSVPGEKRTPTRGGVLLERREKKDAFLSTGGKTPLSAKTVRLSQAGPRASRGVRGRGVGKRSLLSSGRPLSHEGPLAEGVDGENFQEEKGQGSTMQSNYKGRKRGSREGGNAAGGKDPGRGENELSEKKRAASGETD